MEMDSHSNQNLSKDSPESRHLVLSDTQQGQAKLDELLAGCFALQKMYGRNPESMETVTDLFHSMLGKYQAVKVVKAFEAWLERSQEFPTPADIIGLIRRNGRPPMTESQYVAINQKDGEARTPDDWQFLRDWEQERLGWDEPREPLRQASDAKEMLRLRDAVEAHKRENSRLAELLLQERAKVPVKTIDVTQRCSMDDKIAKTIAFMRETGSSDDDIEAFKKGAAA